MPLRRRIQLNNENEGEVKKLYSLFTIFLGLIVAILLVTVGGTIIYYALTMDLPSIDALKDYRPSIASSVYDDNNELIDEFFLEDRKIVKIDEVPKVVHYAFVASEDSRFYQHQGLDIQSIFRAMFKNFEAGHIVQGGSTITQQVAKMMYLSPEKKYIRKFKEAILAYKIDKYLTKDEILNLYLNQIYLGHGTYGIESASLGYFGKSAKELTLPEAALLAGLPKAPNTYSPFLHYDKAKQRQAYVLDAHGGRRLYIQGRNGQSLCSSLAIDGQSDPKIKSPLILWKTSAVTCRKNTARMFYIRKVFQSIRL